MKAKLVIMAGCLGLLISSYSFANGCGNRGGCPDTRCTPPESPCACTDPGWRWDNCISKSKFCEAFGNIGGIDE